MRISLAGYLHFCYSITVNVWGKIMKLSILIKEFYIGIGDDDRIITFAMSEKFNTYDKALNRIAKYLENSYETDLELKAKESNYWRKYSLKGRGGHLTMQIIGRSEA